MLMLNKYREKVKSYWTLWNLEQFWSKDFIEFTKSKVNHEKLSVIGRFTGHRLIFSNIVIYSVLTCCWSKGSILVSWSKGPRFEFWLYLLFPEWQPKWLHSSTVIQCLAKKLIFRVTSKNDLFRLLINCFNWFQTHIFQSRFLLNLFCFWRL